MTIHITISGDVTGVGYRAWMKTQANSAGVFGWVRNKDRGAVEALVQGERDKLGQIINLCKKGPDNAWVKDIEVNSVSESEIYSDFKILK